MALLHKNLSKQVDYHHDIDAYEESKTTKNIQRQTIRSLSKIRKRPQSQSVGRKKSCQHKKQVLYNKWYINPQHQFKHQVKNPKNQKKLLNDEEYVYNNLRNPQFWNWVHPFENGKLPSLKTPDNLDKIDYKMLQGFKRYLLQSPLQRRLPSIVEYVLVQKFNKNNVQKQ